MEGMVMLKLPVPSVPEAGVGHVAPPVPPVHVQAIVPENCVLVYELLRLTPLAALVPLLSVPLAGEGHVAPLPALHVQLRPFVSKSLVVHVSVRRAVVTGSGPLFVTVIVYVRV